MTRVALLGVVGACASVPPGPPEITGDVIHVTDGADITIDATHYQMKFPPRDLDVVRMPMTLAIKSTVHDNLLGDDPVCTKESRIGAAIYPAAVAVAGREAPRSEVTHSDATARLTGPAVAKIEVDSVLPFTCGQQDVFAVNTVFTFFPDGRITREERVKSSETPLPANTPCGCANENTAGGFFLTSWYAFDQDALMVDRNGTLAGPGDFGDDDACATWDDVTVALHYSGMTTRITPNYAPSFVLDMATASSGDFSSMTRMNTSTMMVMPPSTPPPQCRDVLDRITLPQLEIANTPTSPSPDGVYRDTTKHSQTFDINAAVAGATVQPFAVAVAIGEHAEIISNKRDATGLYVAQYQSDDEVYLWFPNGLIDGEQITITPK